MQNAHAAAGGHLDEESSAAIEEQIKQQLAGKTVTPTQKEAEVAEPNIVPAGNFTRHEAPAILGEPDLSKNSQTEKVNPFLCSCCSLLSLLETACLRCRFQTSPWMFWVDNRRHLQPFKYSKVSLEPQANSSLFPHFCKFVLSNAQ